MLQILWICLFFREKGSSVKKYEKIYDIYRKYFLYQINVLFLNRLSIGPKLAHWKYVGNNFHFLFNIKSRAFDRKILLSLLTT